LIVAATKIDRFPIHTLSLDAITVDHAIQSRVSTNIEYQREFSEAMLRGDVFPPIGVVFDGKDYWMWDGFHRYGAAKQAAKAAPRKKASIRAEVRQGTRRDAIVLSAGANIKFSIPRTPEDIKKAVWMLLEDGEWFSKTAAQIAVHCGINSSTAQRYRVAYCESRNVDVPSIVTLPDGRKRTKRSMGGDIKKVYRLEQGNHGRFYFTARVDNKQVYLGKDQGKAEEKLAEILSKRSQNKLSLNKTSLAHFLTARDLHARSIGLNVHRFPMLSGFTVKNCICVYSYLDSHNDVLASIAMALALKKLVDDGEVDVDSGFNRGAVDSVRLVVVCYPEYRHGSLIDLGRRMGVEFLTPEELVARVKGIDDHPSPL
jgi:hypothetical protein